MQTHQKKIIVVGIDRSERDELLEALSRCECREFEAESVETLGEARESVTADGVECAVLLAIEPASSEIAALLADGREIAVVCIAESDTTSLLAAGVDDVLPLNSVDEQLESAIENAIELAELRRKIRALAEEFESRETERQAGDTQILEFYSTIATELRPPLAGVRAQLERLNRGDGGPVLSEQKQYLDICLDGTAQLSTLTGNLAVLVEIDRGELVIAPETESVGALLGAVVAQHRERAAMAEIHLVNVDRGHAVVADPCRTKDVLSRLVDNALKFTPEGGSVVLDADQETDGFIRFFVEDTGPGIAPEDWARVFLRTQQSGGEDAVLEPGLGLGLGICRGLVELQGGRIWLETTPGGGTTVLFTLPSSREESASPTSCAPAPR